MAIGGTESTTSATNRWCTADPSRLYIIAILRPTERTVSKLTELARKLGMICTAGPLTIPLLRGERSLAS